MSALQSRSTDLPRALLWLVLVLGTALGIGGLVTLLDHPPGDVTRPELTVRGDRAAAATIASLDGQIAPLGEPLAALRPIGRDALAHATAGDHEALRADLTAGNGVLDRVPPTIAAIEGVLAELPAGVERSGLGQLNQARLASVDMVLSAMSGLSDAWRGHAPRAMTRGMLARSLEEHRDLLAAAIGEANAGRYAGAIVRLDDATARLDRAEQHRADLAAAGADVSVLGEWLLRARTRDEAHRALDRLLVAGGGDASAVTTARTRVAAAERAMPLTDDELIATLDEASAAEIDEAIIAIESASGAVDDARRLLAAP